MRIAFGICIVFLLAGVAVGIHTFSKGLITTNMNQRVPWGLDVAVYTYCMGISAGSFIISILPLLGFKQLKPLSRVAILQAMILAVIAPIFLLAAMGRPERFYLLFLSPNPTSIITWGTFSLLLFPIVALAYGYCLIKRDAAGANLSEPEIKRHDKRVAFWGFLGLALAIFVGVYSGILLAFIVGRPLWHTAIMPALFLTSAILSGVALLIVVLAIMNAVTQYKTEKPLFLTLAKWMFAFLHLDVFFLACYIVIGMYGQSGEVYEAWMVLLSGKYFWPFIGGGIILGALVPVVVLPVVGKTMNAIVGASCLILLGVFAVRYSILLGGQVIQAYGGPEGEYFPSMGEWIVMLGIFSLGGILFMTATRYLPLMPRVVPAVSTDES